MAPLFLKTSLALVSLAMLSSIVAGCSTNFDASLEDCKSFCELAKSCGAGQPGMEDCGRYCEALDQEVVRIGCEATYADATSCVVAEGSCMPQGCTAATDAFDACLAEFCAQNPGDAECGG